MSASTQSMCLGTSALTASNGVVRSSNGLGCLVTPLYGRQRSAVSHLPSRGTFLVHCCSNRIPRRPPRHQEVSPQRAPTEKRDGGQQPPQGNRLHAFWLQAVKPGLLTGLLFAMALLVAPSAQASWIKRRKPEPQPAQVESARSWLAPAAVSMESVRHRAGQAAHAADKNVLQPVIQQTQHTAAGTKRWLQSMVGSQERSAREPRSENMTIEEHLQESMESPAVRILVTVGAVSVLLLLVRTSMEESSAKKFSPMDSDDWSDDREVPDLEEGEDAGYPRSPATFTGSAAEAAATLAARADAIADKADNMRGMRRPSPPDVILMQDDLGPEAAQGAAPPPAPRAAASAAHAPSPAQIPTAVGLPNVEAVQPSVQPEPVAIEPVGMREPVPVQPVEMPAPKPVEASAVMPPKPADMPAPKPVEASAIVAPKPAEMPAPKPVEASAIKPPKPLASPPSSPKTSGSAQSMPSAKDPAIKEVLPAGTLEAFASNRKLREQLEEVRSSVTHAKAQVDAAGSISEPQVQESLAQRTSRLQEQQQLPVFKTTALEGTPVDYQPRSSPSVDAQARSTSPVDNQAPAAPPADFQTRSTPIPATARTGLAPESARRPSMAEHPPGTSPSRPERPSFGPPSSLPPAVGSSPSRPPRPSFGPPSAPPPALESSPSGPPRPSLETPLPAVGSSPSSPSRPSFGPPSQPPLAVGSSPSQAPRPSFGPPSQPPPAVEPSPSNPLRPSSGLPSPDVEASPSRPARPSFGPPSKPPAPARKTPVVRYETSQGEPVKAPRPTQNGNGAFRLPWQPKGEKKSNPLPSLPQPTSPARAVSIATEPATKEGKREARALGQQVKESEDFLRRRGNEAPAVVALSFLSAAVSALAPLVMDKEERERRARQTQQRRQRWRELSAAEKELDWQRYGKYDALQQLLQSAADDPSFKESDRSPAKTIVSAVPKKGRPKYDFLRQVAKDLINSRHGPERTDPVWNLLQLVKEKQAPVRASTAPNPVFEWLNRAAAAADWGLPEAGPAAALLRLDASDWEPPGYCPVYDVLKSARAGGPAPWHNNIRSSQDPLTGLLAMEAPRGVSKFDPLPHAVRIEAPAGRSHADPFARVIDFFHTRTSAKGDLPKLPSVLPGEPPRPESTPVAALTEAAAAVQSMAASSSNSASTAGSPTTPTAGPAGPKGSSGTLDQPAASSTASAMTQQAALRSGAGSVTSKRGQGWLRAMWNRSTSGKAKQNAAAASQNGSAGAMPGATKVDAVRPTVKPLQPSAAEAQTKSLAQALSSAQQAMQDARQGTNGVPTQARQGADRVPTEGSQQGATMTSSPARQAAAPKLARQGAYNPLPDLLRLERGMDTPIGSACDLISIMLRRDSDFGPVAAAFKELAADELLQKDYWPLYTLMRRAAAAPLLAFPESDEEAALEGLNEVTVGEARKTAKSFAGALDTPQYKALHGLLGNRRSIDIVEAACAMAIIVQPFQKA